MAVVQVVMLLWLPLFMTVGVRKALFLTMVLLLVVMVVIVMYVTARCKDCYNYQCFEFHGRLIALLWP